jgi:uncharacterized protein YccT (UPF0319 family)
LLILCKRAKLETQKSFSFLCIQVDWLDENYYKKMCRQINYLQSALKTIPLSIDVKNVKLFRWWINASFDVHTYVKSHSCASLSYLKGVLHGTSTKNKLNTQSSMEAIWLI